jgi:hypothetical protein
MAMQNEEYRRASVRARGDPWTQWSTHPASSSLEEWLVEFARSADVDCFAEKVAAAALPKKLRESLVGGARQPNPLTPFPYKEGGTENDLNPSLTKRGNRE